MKLPIDVRFSIVREGETPKDAVLISSYPVREWEELPKAVYWVVSKTFRNWICA